jgi:hypothetical protein
MRGNYGLLEAGQAHSLDLSTVRWNLCSFLLFIFSMYVINISGIVIDVHFNGTTCLTNYSIVSVSDWLTIVVGINTAFYIVLVAIIGVNMGVVFTNSNVSFWGKIFIKILFTAFGSFQILMIAFGTAELEHAFAKCKNSDSQILIFAIFYILCMIISFILGCYYYHKFW